MAKIEVSMPDTKWANYTTRGLLFGYFIAAEIATGAMAGITGHAVLLAFVLTNALIFGGVCRIESALIERSKS